MSFIYAFKDKNRTFMFGDTKVLIDEKNKIDNFKDEHNLITQMGILKAVVFSPFIAIGFVSDNLWSVEKAFKDLLESPEKFCSKEQIVKHLEFFTKDNSTDFILIYKNEYIFKISNGKSEECSCCHIGSLKALKFLQEQKKNRKITEDLISTIFHDLVFSRIDESVGGFVTEIYYDSKEEKLLYKESMQTVVEYVHFETGEEIPIYRNKENGGYALETMTVIDDIGNLRFGVKFLQTDEKFCYLPLKNKLSDNFKCDFQYLFLPLKITEDFID